MSIEQHQQKLDQPQQMAHPEEVLLDEKTCLPKESMEITKTDEFKMEKHKAANETIQNLTLCNISRRIRYFIHHYSERYMTYF